MKSALRLTVSALALIGIGLTPAVAQRQVTPEQRIDRLERQVRQVQKQIFPKGQPADTALFSDEPAATATSVRTLDDRLNSLERQLADILRQSEENGHRVAQMESDLARLRADNDQRLQSLERAGATATTETAEAEPAVTDAPPPAPKPKVEKALAATSMKPDAIPTTNVAPASDPPDTASDHRHH